MEGNFQEEGSHEQKILENTTTIKNEYHFSDGEKRIKDYDASSIETSFSFLDFLPLNI